MTTALPFLLFHLLSALVNAVAAQQIRYTNISLGSSLTPTSTNLSWPSPSGLYAFGFFQQNINGYAVGVFVPGPGVSNKSTVVWIANRDNPTVPYNDAVLQLTLDGRLILQREAGRQDNIDVVSTSQPIASASMLDNGNFVLYNSDFRIIWQSFDYPTDTLLPGQRLRPGEELVSSASETDHSKGIFRLKMQTDGNLVQYPVGTPDSGGYAYYASETNTPGGNVSLNLGNDARLYLMNGNSLLRNLTDGVRYPTGRMMYIMRIDVDGIFRLYSRSINPQGNWTVLWSAIEGRCGINAFSILIDDVPNCSCLPGFAFVQPGNWVAGCTRNFTLESCGEKDDRVKYEIRTVDNTVWQNDPYDVLDTQTEEDCREACLDDCSCGAAFFKDRQCSKQKLPLRYGRTSMNDSNVALVRVRTSTTTPDDTGGDSGNSFKEIKKEPRLDILIISISLMVVSVLVLSISVIYVHRKRGHYKKITEHGEANLIQDVALRAFTFAQLSEATNDFKEELGKGASATVYKGILQNSQKTTLVAVKRLEKEFAEGEREFQNEMKTIWKMYHRNLVRLLGYCLDGPNKLLVFEYMSNGSLADILFNPDRPRPSWEERIKLAPDIARGILYLHEECETQIIHCDIKPQNILMDERGCAKISDFGLAKLLKQDQTNTFTGVRGTKGYVAPEYWHQKQPVTVKADVYSFGVVLLEIICCRRSVNWNLCEDEAILEEWVYNCYAAGELGKVIGNETVDEKTLERMVKIGIWCIQFEPSLRPTMKKVLLMLEGTVDIPLPPSPTSFLSSIKFS